MSDTRLPKLLKECAPSELKGWKEVCEHAWAKGKMECPECKKTMVSKTGSKDRQGDFVVVHKCECGFEGLTDWGMKALWYPQS
jgi:transposase-like protein